MPVNKKSIVTVAIPVLNGGALLAEVLGAVRAQQLDRELELLVCDSGSSDGSVELARSLGARVIEIARSNFSHGGTRNLLMSEAGGDYVAFLTQDATPAAPDWLAQLLAGFALADDVALVHGPYLPRAGAPPAVARELEQHFAQLAPDGRPVIDRAGTDESWESVSSRATFFTDANGAVARSAWEQVPFPDVPYAEDRLLARRMLEHGFAKVYQPSAGVLHSHHYNSRDLFGRYFDEFRGLRETFGHVESASPLRAASRIRSSTAADYHWALADGAERSVALLAAARAARHHAIRASAAALGSRADRLSPAVRRAISLEGRGSFLPTD